MWSTPSRCSDASQAACTYSGLPLMPTRDAVGVALVAELGRDDDLVAAAGDRLPDQTLVGERPVHVGGVEESAARVEGVLDDVDRLGVVGVAVELAHAHAAEAEG